MYTCTYIDASSMMRLIIPRNKTRKYDSRCKISNVPFGSTAATISSCLVLQAKLSCKVENSNSQREVVSAKLSGILNHEVCWSRIKIGINTENRNFTCSKIKELVVLFILLTP